LLRDPVPLVRATAVQALGVLNDDRVVRELVGMLKDQDAAVRLRAVRSLNQIGWRPEDDTTRTAYVLATGNVADVAELGADGVQPLVELLNNGTPDKQLAAVKALSEINDPRIPQLMQHALNKSSAMVRLVALDTLAQLADPSTAESVHRLFKDQASNIRAAAVGTAVSFRDKSVLPMLLPMLRDISWEVRLEVVKALGKLGDATAVQGLCRALQDPDHDVRENAAQSLGKLGDPRSVQPLVLALMDVQSFVRTAAHNALFRIDRSWKKSDGARSALPHIMAARNHREYWISHSAERLLEQIQPESEDAGSGWKPGSSARETAVPGQPEKSAAHPALAILMDLLRDPDRDFRLAAAVVLGDLRENSAVPNLLIASRDNDPAVRHAAEWAITSLN
jgi:HEAT repeat protein